MAKIPRDERAVTDQDFFQALDPKRRDLTPMRNAAKNGNMEEARRLAVEHFRTRTNPKWFFDMRSKCRGKVPAAWPGLDTGALHRADSLLRNRFLLRGNNEALAFNSGKNLKWRTAEMRQLASTAYALKRGNFFRDLAIAYAHTGRTDYAEKFTYLLERWQADWPLVVDDDFHPKTAVLARSDGHDTMTTAFRWFSWMDCLYSGILFTPQVPSEAAFRLIRSLWFTALQYRTYETSPYVPANHHLFERGTSPFLFGVMLPEFPEVARLVQQAAPVIEKHTEHSFLPDGGYEERTTSYTTSALNMFFIPLRLAARNRMPLLSRASRTRLKRCGEMVALLALPNGAQPDVGDGEAGVSKTALISGNTAALFKSRTAAEVVKRLHLKSLVAPEDRPSIRTLDRTDLPLALHYPNAGYFVARTGWNPHASAMFLSVPGPGIPNHAHDDALSLHLCVRGKTIVGTPMSELYSYLNRNKQARKQRIRGHFYAMTSHNVVLVNKEPLHSIESLIPTWGPEPTPVKTAWQDIPGGVHVKGHHTGYPSIQLAREIEFRHRKGWTVTDTVRGDVQKPHSARWHFEYDVQVEQDGDLYIATCDNVQLSVRISSNGKLRTRLYQDKKWLGNNPLHPDAPPPWILDITFGGLGDDHLETVFEIV